MKKILLGLTAVFLLSVASLYGFYIYQVRVPKSFPFSLAGIQVAGGSWKQFEIEQGKSVGGIAQRLEEEGIVRSALLFRLYARLSNLDRTVKFGAYWVSPELSVMSLVERFQQNKEGIRLTFLEGWRREEFAAYASKTVGRVEFEEEFLASSKGQEGYLFPDTYFVSYYTPAEDLAELLQETFDGKYAEKIAPLQKQGGFTKVQVATIASLLERESLGEQDEKEIIAGIIIKRWKSGWRLDVDAAIQYALGYQEETEEWWKDNLTKEDLAVDSLYNTYKVRGLPPGPICNPGLSSLLAVVNYEESPYWFYLHDRQGRAHFARTIEEHNQNVAEYLR